MYLQEERYCPHCKKIFYVKGFRLSCAKTLSCYYCGKRFKVNPSQKQGEDKEEKWRLFRFIIQEIRNGLK